MLPKRKPDWKDHPGSDIEIVRVVPKVMGMLPVYVAVLLFVSVRVMVNGVAWSETTLCITILPDDKTLSAAESVIVNTLLRPVCVEKTPAAMPTDKLPAPFP
jgi:hypothetical protein